MVAKQIAQSLFAVCSSIMGIMVVFILVGRSLGPEAFGHFALAYASCSLLGVVFDFGYMTRLLHDRRICRSTGKAILRQETLVVKFALWSALSLGLFPVVRIMDLDPNLVIRFWIGISLMSCGNLVAVQLRALGRYLQDARNSFIANLCGAAYVLTMYFHYPNTTAFSWVFVIIGGVFLVLTVATWRPLGVISDMPATRASIQSEFTKGIPYSTDALVQRSTFFFDVVTLGAVTGPATVGLYLAGQKIAQGAGILTQPFNNVFLPKLSKAAGDWTPFSMLARQSFLMHAICGAAAFLGLALIGPSFVEIVYSKSFAQTGDIMWAFGLLAGMRYIAAALSLEITALGQQKPRMFINMASLVLLVALGIWLGQIWGALGVVIAGIISSAFGALCAFWVRRQTMAQLKTADQGADP